MALFHCDSGLYRLKTTFNIFPWKIAWSETTWPRETYGQWQGWLLCPVQWCPGAHDCSMLESHLQCSQMILISRVTFISQYCRVICQTGLSLREQVLKPCGTARRRSSLLSSFSPQLLKGIVWCLPPACMGAQCHCIINRKMLFSFHSSAISLLTFSFLHLLWATAVAFILDFTN